MTAGSSREGLAAEVRVALGTLQLEIALDAAPGELVVLVGPNGAGKSTLLRVLAGLLAIDDGTVVLDGEVLDNPRADVFLKPDRRSVGMVFQSLVLFEHLSVVDNVAFGLRCRGTSTRASRAVADEWIERLALQGVAHLRPSQLSGGQAQRVALARALAFAPRLLLLDEPLAALDASTRVDVRRELRSHLADYSGVRLLVTHDPLEAVWFGDRIVVVEEGRMVQQGTPEEIRARPKSRYVADFVGINLLRGTLRGSTIELPDGAVIAVVASGVPSGAVAATIHPRSVAVHIERPSGSARNVWPVRVQDLDDEGDRIRLRMSGPVPLVAEVTPAARTELQLEPGLDLWASVKATEVSVAAV